MLVFLAAFAYAGFQREYTWTYFFGMTLALASFVLWLIARINLGDSFTMRAEARKLVTTGMYTKFRHPIYTFSSLAVLGLLIALHTTYLYPLFLLLIVVQAIRAKQEEKVLTKTFGKKYLDYRVRTWF